MRARRGFALKLRHTDKAEGAGEGAGDRRSPVALTVDLSEADFFEPVSGDAIAEATGVVPVPAAA